jgi:hypothetical protein
VSLQQILDELEYIREKDQGEKGKKQEETTSKRQIGTEGLLILKNWKELIPMRIQAGKQSHFELMF